MENFYDLLTRCNAAKNGFSKRFLFNACNEFFGDLKIDVGFEQSQAHLPQGCVDVRFADRAVSTQLFEDVLKFVRELGEHADKKLNVAAHNLRMADAFCAMASAHPRDRARLFFRGRYGRSRPCRTFFDSESQCASTFFPWDFALIITLQDFSCNFCVT